MGLLAVATIVIVLIAAGQAQRRGLGGCPRC